MGTFYLDIDNLLNKIKMKPITHNLKKNIKAATKYFANKISAKYLATVYRSQTLWGVQFEYSRIFMDEIFQ